MKSFKDKVFIKASPNTIWAALTQPHHLQEWTGNFAVMNPVVGGEFKLWDGDVFGVNTEVTSPVELRQNWFGGNWPSPSLVTFTLFEKDGGTELQINHENIPDEEYEDVKKGWKDYYFNPLKEYTENLI